MRLKSLSYKENISTDNTNPWEIENLTLRKHNLIVGKNATGKTRIIHVINNFAFHIKIPLIISNSEWIAHFEDDEGEEFKYSVSWKNNKVISEQILVKGIMKLDRTSSNARIFSDKDNDWQTISPPNDRLVLHVRRDKNEFPFLEQLFSWAIGVCGFSFSNTYPTMIEIHGSPSSLTSLNAVPSALENLSDAQKVKVLKQLEKVGYVLENASTGWIEGLHPSARIVFFKELGITNQLKQFEVSQGMFRAFSILTILESLKSRGGVGLILIDDFGEGLDFERSKNLAEIIFEENSESKIQLIATSNDSFLMNAVPLNDLTVCNRSKHIVKCLNYSNSKGKFDEWKQLGLNNFDLFSSDFLQKE